MRFATSNEHEQLRKQVREFVESEVAPIAFELDQNNQFPESAVKKMGELGFMGLPFEKEYGGQGKDVLSYAIAVEELSRVDGGTGVILSAHVSLGSWPIYAYGNEMQKQKYLIPLLKGEKIGAFGLTERNAGSDAGRTETTAVLDGDHYILNGHKIFITNAPYADTYVVFASCDPSKKTRGISAFIVEKGWDGFTYGTHYDKLGIRSSSTCELIFKDVKVPKENLLGKEGDGFKIAMATLDGGRIGIASQALGIAQGAYEEALEYAKNRVQFDAPIASNQAISFKLADMATKLRCARMLIYSAAELKQEHLSYGMEAAMAKMYASDICLEVVNDALQIFGGSGYLKGMKVERAYRDAKITTIYEGTNEIQRVVIASYLIGKAKKQVNKVETKENLRKQVIYKDGNILDRVNKLLEALKQDGYDFNNQDQLDTPISASKYVFSIGRGVENQENMDLVKDAASMLKCSLASSRPVAETMKLVSMDRFVGMSGQKFNGEFYFACGISGAKEHLLGISNAKKIIAINTDENAPIMKNCDYGIVGDLKEVLPEIISQLGKNQKKKYVCSVCGYVYDGPDFLNEPSDYVCPLCGAPKDLFIEQ